MNPLSLATVIPPSVLKSVESLDFELAEWDRNPRISKLLSATVLQGGKRLRPILTFMVAELFGVKGEDVAPFARMIELVHASSLAHDDVVDEASTRRGQPSINALSSNKHAVLAGDYLLAYVLQEISAYGQPALVIELSRIIADLAEGEWLQMENSHKENLSWRDIEEVALRKTGSVLRWSWTAPALIARKDAHFVARCRRLGEAIGIAFQLTDDILDFKRKDGAEGADLKNRVVNAVIFEALCLKTGRDHIDMSQIEDLNVDEHLEAAIARVRVRVDALVSESHALLRELAEECASTASPVEASLAGMINVLARRI